MKMTFLALALLSFTASANEVRQYKNLTKKATISMADAILAAEDYLKGDAVSAELEVWKRKVKKKNVNTIVYDVDVLAKNRIYEIYVDARSGRVIRSRVDN